MQSFECVRKCYYMDRRWRPGDVYDHIPGSHDGNGKPVRTPEEAGVGRCFKSLTQAQAVRSLDRTEGEKPERAPRKRGAPIDFREQFDTHD